MITQNSLVSQFALQNFKLYILLFSVESPISTKWWQRWDPF